MRFRAFIFTLFAFPVFCQAGVEQVADWTSLLPPLVAIVLALLLREVLISLSVGVLTGLVLSAMRSSQSLTGAVLDIPITLRDALFSKDHLSIIVFTVLIGAMVAVISKNGGMMALVKRIAKRANTARSGQFATWLLGVAIFFDDYANTLVVGNTMRPLTDRLKISREKLAYIVDSTAAPVAAVAFITTWIGAELSYISNGIGNIEKGEQLIGNAYGVFFQSLQYMFYPFLTLFFILMLIRKQVDFGPMLTAERLARKSETSNSSLASVGEVDDVEDSKERVFNGLLPILTMIGVAAAGLIYLGSKGYTWDGDASFTTNLSNIIGRSDSYLALLWASFSGLVVAIVLTVVQKIHSIRKTMEFVEHGVKTMIPAIMILTLAWALGGLTEQLGTAEFLSDLIGGNIRPEALPTIVFILAALIAFSTGTSWGTMSILYPLVLGTTWSVCQAGGLDVDSSLSIFANVVATVIAGSVLGDHCSPISDTTIMSSLATECDHIEHVRTQLPYAITVGVVSILLGTLPSGFGIPFYVTFPIALLTLWLIVSYFGKSSDTVGD